MPASPHDTLVAALDAVLPQTQCARCGYDGCRPYAEAVAQGEAINRCPPGGTETVRRLAAITRRPVQPLADPDSAVQPLHVARIDETYCIGCTLCIDACPVEAIVGAVKRMHGVLSALCTGCERCVPPCPVDCIAMVPAGRAWSPADREAARLRYALQRERRGTPRVLAGAQPADEPAQLESAAQVLTPEARRAAAAAAVVRARERRARAPRAGQR